jgi:hypothetical protein
MRRIAGARWSRLAGIAVISVVVAMAATAIAGQDATISISKQRVRTIAVKVAKKVTRKKLNRRFPVGSSRLGTISTRSVPVALPPSPPGTAFDGTASCGAGEKVISGGFGVSNNAPVSLTISQKTPTGEAWTVRVVTNTGTPPGLSPMVVQANCLAP